jgi:CheY-like chemotaxis protein
MRRCRVLLADDHKMLADTLKELLEPRYEVVGLVSDGRELLSTARYVRFRAVPRANRT